MHIQAFVDFTALLPKIQGNMQLIARYKVTADGFKTKEKDFKITLSNNLKDAKINYLVSHV